MAKQYSVKLSSRPPDSKEMSLGDHLAELRLRVILSLLGLLLCFIFCLFFGWQLIAFFAAPLMAALARNELPRAFLATGIATGFITYMKVSLAAAVFLAAPWIFYQLWRFVACGLYNNEKRLVNFFAPFSAGLFILGGLFFMYIVAPLTINFFLDFNSGLELNESSDSWYNTLLDVGSESQPSQEPSAVAGRFFLTVPVPFSSEKLEFELVLPASEAVSQSLNSVAAIETRCTINDYISFILAMTLAFGFAFQMPLAVYLTGILGLVSIVQFRKVRKYVFLAIIVIAAIVTPADLFSQLALAIPMYLLYELGILLLLLLSRKAVRS